MTSRASASGSDALSKLAELDLAGLRLARTAGHTPAAERAAATFSLLGEHGAVWFALAGVTAATTRDPARRRAAGRAAATVLGAFVANVAIKNVVRRRRPDLADLPPLVGTPTGLSFPSTHASTSFAGAAALSAAGLPSAPLHLLAASLAASRLYLGVHYPSDIGAGVALGSVLGRLAT